MLLSRRCKSRCESVGDITSPFRRSGTCSTLLTGETHRHGYVNLCSLVIFDSTPAIPAGESLCASFNLLGSRAAVLVDARVRVSVRRREIRACARRVSYLPPLIHRNAPSFYFFFVTRKRALFLPLPASAWHIYGIWKNKRNVCRFSFYLLLSWLLIFYLVLNGLRIRFLGFWDFDETDVLTLNIVC